MISSSNVVVHVVPEGIEAPGDVIVIIAIVVIVTVGTSSRNLWFYMGLVITKDPASMGVQSQGVLNQVPTLSPFL